MDVYTDVYTATPVACRWAGALIEKVAMAFGQLQWAKKAQKRRKNRKDWWTDATKWHEKLHDLDSIYEALQKRRNSSHPFANSSLKTMIHSFINSFILPSIHSYICICQGANEDKIWFSVVINCYNCYFCKQVLK